MKKLLIVVKFALNNGGEVYVHTTMLSQTVQYFMPDKSQRITSEMENISVKN